MTGVIEIPLPCTFCGGTSVSTRDGSPSCWWLAECKACGATWRVSKANATSEDDNKQLDKQASKDAMAMWNTRGREE